MKKCYPISRKFYTGRISPSGTKKNKLQRLRIMAIANLLIHFYHFYYLADLKYLIKGRILKKSKRHENACRRNKER
jgi:hypothetical protein